MQEAEIVVGTSTQRRTAQPVELVRPSAELQNRQRVIQSVAHDRLLQSPSAILPDFIKARTDIIGVRQNQDVVTEAEAIAILAQSGVQNLKPAEAVVLYRFLTAQQAVGEIDIKETQARQQKASFWALLTAEQAAELGFDGLTFDQLLQKVQLALKSSLK